VVTKGFDTYVQMMMHEWEIYVGYTFTIAERKYLPTNNFMPLTPKNRMAFTLVRSWDKPGIMTGVEASYTGSQFRFDGSKTPEYVFAAAMIRKNLSEKIRLVLNCENLLDYRQSRVEALYSGSISAPEFNALWAPTDGRVVNLSIFLNL
jgi:iron complex outermembrane receptor protein/outer membrane receptor for ferrienterochelin and colicins